MLQCAVLIASPGGPRKPSDCQWLVGSGRAISLTPRVGLDSRNRSRMRIQLNGRDHELSGNISLAKLVEQLGLDVRKVAVERNLEIVPRSAYAATVLHEGDRLELVNFVGGG